MFVGIYTKSFVDNTSPDDWTIGPMLTYYVNHHKRADQFQQFFPFVNCYYLYGNEGNLKKSRVGIQTGVILFVSKNIGLDYLISYERTIYDYGSDYEKGTGNQIYTGFGISTFIL